MFKGKMKRGRPRKSKIIPPLIKRCPQCKMIKSIDDFSNCSSSRDGKQPICKLCDNSNKKSWYRANREREIKKRKEWIEKNRERHNEIAYSYLVRTGKIKNPRRPVTVFSRKETYIKENKENKEIKKTL